MEEEGTWWPGKMRLKGELTRLGLGGSWTTWGTRSRVRVVETETQVNEVVVGEGGRGFCRNNKLAPVLARRTQRAHLWQKDLFRHQWLLARGYSVEHVQRRLGPQTTRVSMENKANEINKDTKAFKGLPPTLTCPIFLVLTELRPRTFI